MKRIVWTLAALLLCLSAAFSARALGSSPALFDGADLLTDGEEAAVLSRMEQISRQYQVEIVVAAVESTDGADADDFAEAYYDSGTYGYGHGRDGVLLLVAMESRDWRILSNGRGSDAIGSGEIDEIGNAVQPLLRDGEYEEAFLTFAEGCAYYLEGELHGFAFETGKNLLISVGIGFAAALVVTGIWWAKLKSVKRRWNAAEYVVPGSMNLTHSSDFFLYRNVTRIQKASSSSSSSGSSRSIGGGKF